MNFPEQVIFRLVDNKTKKPVKNIAVLLILYGKGDVSVFRIARIFVLAFLFPLIPPK